MNKFQLMHYRPTAYKCDGANLLSAWGTNDIEKVTCKVCKEVAATEVERKLGAARPEPCSGCGGRGVFNATDQMPFVHGCPTCGGKGSVTAATSLLSNHS